MLCGSASTRLRHELKLAKEECDELRDVGKENARLRDQVVRLQVEVQKHQAAAECRRNSEAAPSCKGGSLPDGPNSTETELAAARAEVTRLRKEVEKLNASAVQGHSERLTQRAEARARRLSLQGSSLQLLSNRPPAQGASTEDEIESEREWMALGWSGSDDGTDAATTLPRLVVEASSIPAQTSPAETGHSSSIPDAVPASFRGVNKATLHAAAMSSRGIQKEVEQQRVAVTMREAGMPVAVLLSTGFAPETLLAAGAASGAELRAAGVDRSVLEECPSYDTPEVLSSASSWASSQAGGPRSAKFDPVSLVPKIDVVACNMFAGGA